MKKLAEYSLDIDTSQTVQTNFWDIKEKDSGSECLQAISLKSDERDFPASAVEQLLEQFSKDVYFLGFGANDLSDKPAWIGIANLPPID